MITEVTGNIFGIALIAGAILFVLAWFASIVLGEPMVDDVAVSRWLAVPAHILLLIGVFGLYLAQADRVGVWGLAGSLLAVAGLAIFVGYVIGGWTTAIPEPRLGPVGGIMWITGLLILAVVTWQGDVLPKWSGVIWMVGVIVYVATVPTNVNDTPRVASLVGATVIAIGLAWAGAGIVRLN